MDRLDYTASRKFHVLIIAASLWILSGCQSKTQTNTDEAQLPDTAAIEGNTAAESKTSESDDFDGPTPDIRALGWSADGKMFAYREFYFSPEIYFKSSIRIVVMNVITDSVLWHFNKIWDDGYTLVGDEGDTTNNGSENLSDSQASEDPSVPQKAEEAWSRVQGEVIPIILNRHAIAVQEDALAHEPYAQFPLIDSSGEITAKAQSLDSDGYDRVIVLSPKGEREIYKQEKQDGLQQFSIHGYFINPQKRRIAVVAGGWYMGNFKPDNIVTGFSF